MKSTTWEAIIITVMAVIWSGVWVGICLHDYRTLGYVPVIDFDLGFLPPTISLGLCWATQRFKKRKKG